MYESYWTFIYIIDHFIFQTADSKPTLCCHCNICCYSHKWQWEITICFVCCVDTLILLQCYINLINLFNFFNNFSNKISSGFVSITENKVSLFFWERKLFLRFECFIIFIHINSLYESYWPFIYMIFNFIFQTSDYKSTFFCHCNHHCSSRKRQWEIIISFARFINTIIWLGCYIYSIKLFYFINRLLKHNLYWFCRYQRKEGICFFEGEQNLFPQFDFFFHNINSLYESYWPFIYIIFFSLFKQIISNQLSADTTTVVFPVISDNRQSLFFYLLHLYTHTIMVLHIFDWFILFYK